MKVHEYQAKEVFRRFKIPTLKGGTATSAAEAQKVADGLGSSVVVVKSQVHLGGRGKGTFREHGEDGPRGVNVVKDVSKVSELASKMLGSTLVTHQGEEVCKLLFLEEGCQIADELYCAVVVDRASQRAIIMASTEGGVNIEEVAAETPEKILKETIDPDAGLRPFKARRLAYKLGMTGDTAKAAATLFINLARLFQDLDASMAEINPLVITGDGGVIALDGKMSFDENALYRHQDLVEAYGGSGDADPVEMEAAELGLSYVKLDGEIGCLVNGAGLAMATMDIIKHSGSSPANFLDVGGTADEDRVAAAFNIILRDPNVKAILVNIFGGIVQCDMIAKGVLGAVRKVGLKVPLVVRLEGTNSQAGREILAGSDLAVISATSMSDAAEKVVAVLKKS